MTLIDVSLLSILRDLPICLNISVLPYAHSHQSYVYACTLPRREFLPHIYHNSSPTADLYGVANTPHHHDTPLLLCGTLEFELLILSRARFDQNMISAVSAVSTSVGNPTCFTCMNGKFHFDLISNISTAYLEM
jgi:hypothetical protein